uniref:MTBp n=1 Tax=Tetrahymena pyriformis TaxID=5908 RepID=A0A513X598_TETPY|nr:MTBp [Tetrahymena pyriformis]
MDQIASLQPPYTLTVNWTLEAMLNSTVILSGSPSSALPLSCTQSQCSLCVNSGEICNECINGYYLYEDISFCVQQCPPNTSVDEVTKTCKSCNTQQSGCQSCLSTDINACTQCTAGFSINAGQPASYCYIPQPVILVYVPEKTVINSSSSNSGNSKTSSESSNAIMEFIQNSTKGLLLSSILPVAGLCSVLSFLVHKLLKIKGKAQRPNLQLDSEVPQSDRSSMDSQVSIRSDQNSIPFSWVAVLLFFTNFGDLLEVPYILLANLNSSSVTDVSLSKESALQISLWIYIGLHFLSYLSCLFISFQAFVFTSYTSFPVFSIFTTSDTANSMNQHIPFARSHTPQAADSPPHRRDRDSHLESSRSFNFPKNAPFKTSYSKYMKQAFNFATRFLIALLGQAFSMLFTNIANAQGWFTISFKQNYQLIRQLYRILVIHTMLNILKCIFFSFILTDSPLSSLFSTSSSKSSSIFSHSENGILFSPFFDLLLFKLVMSVISFSNCSHVRSLLNNQDQLMQLNYSPNLTSQTSPLSDSNTGGITAFIKQSGIKAQSSSKIRHTSNDRQSSPLKIEDFQLDNRNEQQGFKERSLSPYSKSSTPNLLATSSHQTSPYRLKL